MAIEPGRLLHERYRLVRPLGQGSQATVWVADHLALSTQVAVKLIDPELAKQEAARDRFHREAKAAAQLRSAHVVQILDHGIEGDQPFIVMELLEGEDLFERLTERGHLSLRETSRIVTQVARALVRAHAAGIVHRDLKPENVFLVSNEDDEIVKVLDFGVAKVNDPQKATMQRTGIGTLIGTPHYMSPEQVKGVTEVDHRTDLWALGVIAFQCVTGEMPFDSEGVGDLLIRISMGEIPVPSVVQPGLPPAFDAWFARACERDVAKRFQSARDMALALAAVVGHPSDGTKPTTVRPPPSLFAPEPEPESLRAPWPPPHVTSAPVHRPLWEDAIAPVEIAHVAHDSTDVDFDEPESFPLLVAARPAASTTAHPIAPVALLPLTRTPPPSGFGSHLSTLVASSSGVPAPPASQPIASVAALPSASGPQQGFSSSGPLSGSASSGAPSARQAMAPPPPLRPTPVISAPAPPAPREAMSGDHFGARGPSSARRTTVSGVAHSGMPRSEPPPELDGSRRRRLVSMLAAVLVVGAVVLLWGVIESQLPPSSASMPDDAPTGAPSTPTPPASSAKRPLPPPAMSAIDPGKTTRPVRPMPSGLKQVPSKKGPMPRKPDDGTIVIPAPDLPDNAGSPAP